MKKLKIKVFSIIFIILSLFIALVLVVSNYRTYQFHYNRVSGIIEKPSNRRDLNIRNIFMDSLVYTIILDSNGASLEIINNTNSDIDESYVISVANEIINNHSYDKYVGNLYLNKYSYSFSNNSLTIVDNTKTINELTSNLLLSVGLFIILEVIVYFIVCYITRWVTEPVEESFIKQKRFIADASHELKTPISVIMASCDAYNSDKDIKWVNNIKSESLRMEKLVKDLLDLAKMDIVNVEISEVDLSNVLESSILTFESLFYDKNIKLDYDINDSIKYNCNIDQMKQLIAILIDNAIKYTNKNGKVKIDLYDSNKDIILEVMNSGNLIKDEDRNKIFERFYKVDNSRNRNNNNYGLGLSIAKAIVDSYKGNISLEVIDKMNVFKVVLPK